jgi:hypothetical protein
MGESRETVDALQRQLAEQRAMIQQLEARLRVVESLPEPTVAQHHEAVEAAALVEADEPRDLEIIDATTGRRHLLKKATAVVAGAVAGGTALNLLSASPAAAASGSFDSPTGIALTADTTTGTAAVLQTANGGAHMRISGSSNIGSGNFTVGSIIKDSLNDVYFCITSGNPGKWRKITGLFAQGSYWAVLAPTRVYDSRVGKTPATGPKTQLTGSEVRNVDLTLNWTAFFAADRVTADTTAAQMVVTVVNTSAQGYLTVWQEGKTKPGTSTVNWFLPNSIVANTTTVGLIDSGGVVSVQAGSGACDLLIDVIGVYR